jgi:alpha-1,3-glucosyltransferase
MSFFLFSFQVHEKTILLPLLPMTLLLSGSSPESSVFAWGVLANNVGVFSMWPLLKRDGLAVQYVATLVLWNRLIGYNPLRLQKNSVVRPLSIAVYAACAILHTLELIVQPPRRYPDLFPVLNVLISTPVFVLVWLWSIKCSVEIGWALRGLPGSSHPVKGTPDSDGTLIHERISRARDQTNGVRREMGARAMSLGYSRRKRGSLRPLSVSSDIR